MAETVLAVVLILMLLMVALLVAAVGVIVFFGAVFIQRVVFGHKRGGRNG